jgi:hypothetical protein
MIHSLLAGINPCRADLAADQPARIKCRTISAHVYRTNRETTKEASQLRAHGTVPAFGQGKPECRHRILLGLFGKAARFRHEGEIQHLRRASPVQTGRSPQRNRPAVPDKINRSWHHYRQQWPGEHQTVTA